MQTLVVLRGAEDEAKPIIVEAQFTAPVAGAASVTLQLGNQIAGKTNRYTLLLQNSTGASLRIVSASPQCGCTLLVLKPVTLEDGEVHAVDFSINVPKAAHPMQSYFVNIETEGVIGRAILRMNANVANALAFTRSPPVFRVSSDAWTKDPLEKQIFDIPIAFSAPMKFEQLKVDATGFISGIDWKIAKSGEGYVIRGECTKEDVPPGSSTGIVRLKTSSDNQRFVEQMVTVITTQPAEVVPSNMEFARAEKGSYKAEGFLKLAKISTDDNEPTVVGEITDSAYYVSTEIEKLSARIYRLKVLLTPKDSKQSPELQDSSINWLISLGGVEFQTSTALVKQ